MTFDELISSITPEIYDRLKRAVELGKWDNGVRLTKDQTEQSMRAIIAYDLKYQEENERVGYITPKEHTHCDTPDNEDWQPIQFRD